MSARRRVAIQETRYERAKGPAQLKLDAELSEWVRACRRHRRDLVSGRLEPNEDGRYPAGPTPPSTEA